MGILPTRFIVLCHARTGSTLLGSLLAAHPQIAWAGEYFKPLKRQSSRSLRGRIIYQVAWQHPRPYLAGRAACSHRPAYGCKLAPHYVADIERTVPLLQHRGWRIIHLRRRDVFQGALSGCVASSLRHWVTPTDNTAPTASALHIEPTVFLTRLRNRVYLEELELRSVADVPHLEITYEDDLADPGRWPATTDRIFASLGLPSVPVQPAVRQTWDRPYQEIVTNYAELVEAVRSSELAPVLLRSGNTGQDRRQEGK